MVISVTYAVIIDTFLEISCQSAIDCKKRTLLRYSLYHELPLLDWSSVFLMYGNIFIRCVFGVCVDLHKKRRCMDNPANEDKKRHGIFTLISRIVTK